VVNNPLTLLKKPAYLSFEVAMRRKKYQDVPNEAPARVISPRFWQSFLASGTANLRLPSGIMCIVKSDADTLRKIAKIVRRNLEFVISND
jgi:hypothetical protein